MYQRATIEPLNPRRLMSRVYGAELTANVHPDDFQGWQAHARALALSVPPPSLQVQTQSADIDPADRYEMFNFTPTTSDVLRPNGDHNNDGRFDSADYAFICDHPDRFGNGGRIAASAGYGDANFDGLIDKFDVRTLAANFNDYCEFDRWAHGDFTMNGRVTIRDFTVAAANIASQ